MVEGSATEEEVVKPVEIDGRCMRTP
jgi:hypothetical protein